MDPMDPAPDDSKKTETIVAVMRRACPLESDLMGTDALERIAKGQSSYKTLPGGSHIDVGSVVSILSGVATIVDVGWKIWSSSGSRATATTPQFADRLRTAINEQAARSIDLMAVLKNDPQLIERVIQEVKDALSPKPE
jgi:hypothetical protein